MRTKSLWPAPARLAALAFLSFASTAAPAVPVAQSTAAPPPAGCTLHEAVYTCDRAIFRAELAAAHTVAVRAEPMDRQALAQLQTLSSKLGKTLVSGNSDQQPDLVFELLPANETGITFGPADQALAVLRVFAPRPGSAGGHAGTLLWAEILRGQPDRPWASDIGAVIEQFRDHVARH